MPLISRSGSLTSGYESPVPINLPDRLANIPIVRDPALDRMAFDTSQYPEATSALLGYLEGHRLQVTYFNLQGTGGSDVRTNIADSVSERHLLNTAYICINNFEITLQAPWTFNYDPATTESSISGEALFYPGVNPLVNDVFITVSGDNKMALFKITSVTPLSWRNRRVYQVGYTFYKYPGTQDLQLLTSSTIQTLYFDKVNYLDDTVSVLEEDIYVNLQTLRKMRDILAKYYVSQFYSTELDSYIPQTGPYDPYLVRYMAAKCPYIVTKCRPRQLFPNVEQTYGHSIWQRLLDRYNTTWSDLWPLVAPSSVVGTSFDVGLTPLTNQSYLMLVPTPDPTATVSPVSYVLSPAFYANNSLLMTPFEIFLAAALTTRQVTDSSTLINTYLIQYQSLTPSEQFYMIPLYLHLIDMAIQSTARVV